MTKLSQALLKTNFFFRWHYNCGLIWAENTKICQLLLLLARTRQLHIPSADTSLCTWTCITCVGAIASAVFSRVSSRKSSSRNHHLTYNAQLLDFYAPNHIHRAHTFRDSIVSSSISSITQTATKSLRRTVFSVSHIPVIIGRQWWETYKAEIFFREERGYFSHLPTFLSIILTKTRENCLL